MITAEYVQRMWQYIGEGRQNKLCCEHAIVLNSSCTWYETYCEFLNADAPKLALRPSKIARAYIGVTGVEKCIGFGLPNFMRHWRWAMTEHDQD
jgi:hypothetical protein